MAKHLISTETEFDFRFDKPVVEYLLGNQEFSAKETSHELAEDLRNEFRDFNWDIEDQERLGACVGCALGSGLLWFHLMKKARKYRKKVVPKPSSRFIWEAAKYIDITAKAPIGFLTSEGTTLKNGLRVLHKYGALFDKDYDLQGNSHNGTMQLNSRDVYMRAAQQRIANYINLTPELSHKGEKRDQTEENIRKWLSTQGPVAATIWVRADFVKADRTSPPLSDGSQEKTGSKHAICIVGTKGPDQFIIRNSRGKKWGKNGYDYATADYLFGRKNLNQDGTFLNILPSRTLIEAYGIIL